MILLECSLGCWAEEVSSSQSREVSGCKSDWRDPISGPQAHYLTQPNTRNDIFKVRCMWKRGQERREKCLSRRNRKHNRKVNSRFVYWPAVRQWGEHTHSESASYSVFQVASSGGQSVGRKGWIKLTLYLIRWKNHHLQLILLKLKSGVYIELLF